MKRIIYSCLFLYTFFNSSFAQTIVWQDLLNGDNSISGLESRGWVVVNEDTGGTTDAYYQGASVVFPGYDNGVDSGYVAANFLGANAKSLLDQWLISPPLDIIAGDSLVFFARSANFSSIQDSIYLYISDNASASPSGFSLLTGGNFLLSTSNWESYYVRFGTSGTKRFAIRYLVHNHSSGYIGLDYFTLYRKTGINYPSTISLSKVITFSNPANQTSYKMIGIPGQTNFSISQFMSGSNNSDWKAFYDNGAASNYLVEYDGTSQFNLGQGRGFWVLSKNQISITGQSASASLLGANNYILSIHSGWNIISNPFDKDVNWSLVQSNNALPDNAVLYSWNGASWSQTTTFSAYQGYYFNNIYGLASLNIPYDFTNSGLGKVTTNEQNSKILKLSLFQNNNTTNESIEIGINRNAKIDFDKYDLFAPPGDFDKTRIEINEGNLKTNYKKLFTDFRPEVNDKQIYEIDVKNSTGARLTLRADGLDNFPGCEIYLINHELNTCYDLRKNNTIPIDPNPENYNFELVIAKNDSAQQLVENLTPKNYNLDQNYPNPFNPTTIIRYSVPGNLNTSSSTKATLKIYDILGHEITTLVNSEKQPGTYEVIFDGSKLASGIYFYKLGAGNFSLTKKMILLK
jgi:Secretion system C-terminal sorting domain